MSSVSSAFRLLQWERRSKVALQLQWWQRPVLARVSLPLYIHFLHRHVSLKRGNRLFMQLAHTNTHAYSQRLLVRLYFCSELQHRLFDLELRWICFIWLVCVFTLPRHADPCRMQTEIYKVTVNEHRCVYFRQGSQYSVWLRKRPSKVTVRSAGTGWS